MDGCLICGEKHYGACNPNHPEHHPLTADEWDERELRVQYAGDPARASAELIKRRAERQDDLLAEADWVLGTGFPLSQADELEAHRRPLAPQEIIRRIATREGAVSPRDTIQSAAGRWLTVLEVEPPREPPENQKEIAVYGTRGAADERWQDAICRGATRGEIYNAQQAEREAHQHPARDSEEERAAEQQFVAALGQPLEHDAEKESTRYTQGDLKEIISFAEEGRAVEYASWKENWKLKDEVRPAAYPPPSPSPPPWRGIDFQGADLRGLDFVVAAPEPDALMEANFQGADLRGARLRGLGLDGADFQGADLRGADLRGADLEAANFQGADLRGARFRGANLKGANLEGAAVEEQTFRAARMNGEPTIREAVRDKIFATLARLDAWAAARGEAARHAAKTAGEGAEEKGPGRWAGALERTRNWLSERQAAATTAIASAVERVQERRDERTKAAVEQAYPAADRAGPGRRNDVETPGPTEAAGGSFQQFHSKSEAVRAARLLPPSQDYYLDRVHDANGPTDSYVMTTFPAPATIAHDPSVEKKIAALEDPAERAKAWKLLETIRSEVAAQERPISRERSKEIELER